MRRQHNFTRADRAEIRAARKLARELTLKKLAEKWRCSPGTISAIASNARYRVNA